MRSIFGRQPEPQKRNMALYKGVNVGGLHAWEIDGQTYTDSVATVGGGTPRAGKIYPALCNQPDSRSQWVALVQPDVKILPKKPRPLFTGFFNPNVGTEANRGHSEIWDGTSYPSVAGSVSVLVEDLEFDTFDNPVMGVHVSTAGAVTIFIRSTYPTEKITVLSGSGELIFDYDFAFGAGEVYWVHALGVYLLVGDDGHIIVLGPTGALYYEDTDTKFMGVSSVCASGQFFSSPGDGKVGVHQLGEGGGTLDSRVLVDLDAAVWPYVTISSYDKDADILYASIANVGSEVYAVEGFDGVCKGQLVAFHPTTEPDEEDDPLVPAVIESWEYDMTPYWRTLPGALEDYVASPGTLNLHHVARPSVARIYPTGVEGGAVGAWAYPVWNDEFATSWGWYVAPRYDVPTSKYVIAEYTDHPTPPIAWIASNYNLQAGHGLVDGSGRVFARDASGTVTDHDRTSLVDVEDYVYESPELSALSSYYNTVAQTLEHEVNDLNLRWPMLGGISEGESQHAADCRINIRDRGPMSQRDPAAPFKLEFRGPDLGVVYEITLPTDEDGFNPRNACFQAGAATVDAGWLLIECLAGIGVDGAIVTASSFNDTRGVRLLVRWQRDPDPESLTGWIFSHEFGEPGAFLAEQSAFGANYWYLAIQRIAVNSAIYYLQPWDSTFVNKFRLCRYS